MPRVSGATKNKEGPLRLCAATTRSLKTTSAFNLRLPVLTRNHQISLSLSLCPTQLAHSLPDFSLCSLLLQHPQRLMEAASARMAARDRYSGFMEPATTPLQRMIRTSLCTKTPSVAAS